MILTLVLPFFGLLSGVWAAPYASQAPTATIDSGVVVGKVVETAGASVNRFLGIPFAASPVRFAPPTKPTSWSQPYDATNFSDTCPQQFNYPEASRQVTMMFYNQFLQADEGEDCLNLNIWTPSSGGKAKAVMVWIFGGGLTMGSNALYLYDGTSFAADQDVVFVSINYRTNIYGFPGSPQLAFDKQNLGLLDQRLALDWVQRNIHAFGGDPSKVTIFGESAGGASVDFLVLTQPENPPFRAAISQSGTAALYSGIVAQNYPTPWNKMVEAVNCTKSSDILACVRAIPYLNLTSVIEHLALSFRPVIDNITIPSHPETLRLSGNISTVPRLIGSNANEARIFSLPYYNANSSIPILKSTYGLSTQAAEYLASLYPIGSPLISTPFEQISQIATDFTFTCPSGIAVNGTHNHHGGVIPAWRYWYNASFPNTNYLPGIDLGAFHGSEIPEVFGTYPKGGATEEQKRLSEYMQTGWATFAKNPKGGPGWQGWPNLEVLGNNTGGVGVSQSVGSGGIDKNCFVFQGAYRSLGVY